MRLLKKVTAVLLAASMVLSVGLYGNTAQAEEPEVAQEAKTMQVDEVAQDIEYTPLVLDQSMNVTLNENNLVAYFSFTPTEDMACIFESTGATEPISVELYEVTEWGENYLKGDEWIDIRNVRLSHQLKANTEYHFTVEAWLDNTSEISAWLTLKKSPVKSIEVQPIVIVENTSGHTSSGMNPGDAYFHYSWSGLLEYKITMNNGDVIQGRGSGYEYNGNWFSLGTSDNQYSEHWYAGNEYEVTVSCMGTSCTVPVTISEKLEENGYEYVLQNNQAVIISCNRQDEVLVIPETLGGYPVVGITDLTGAVYYAKEIVIPDSVTMVSKGIYEWNYQLEKLTLGSGITNLNNDQFIAAECLEEIVVSDENATYKSIDGVVYDKDVTKIVVFPRAKTGTYKVPDTVTDISALMDNFDYYNVNLDLGNSDVDYVIEEGVLYNKDKTVIYKCVGENTGKYTMPNTVTEIKERAFEECSFSEVVVSENVSEIVYCAFFNSANLENVVLPQNIESIGGWAFSECESLEKVDIPAKVKLIDSYAFSDSGIETTVLREGLEVISSSAFANSRLKEVAIPNSVTILGSYAFMNAPLRKATIGTGIEDIDECTFYGTKLKTITLPEAVNYVGSYAFAESKLEEVVFLNDSVFVDDGAFYNCPIKEVNLENCVYIESDAFRGSQLTEIKISDRITEITYRAFKDSQNLEKIELPEGMVWIDGKAFHNTAWWNNQSEGVVYIDNYLYGYRGIMPENTEITVNEGTTLIAGYAFAYQENLKQVTIPASVQEIGADAFTGCFGLEKIVVAEDSEHFYTNEDGTILYDDRWTEGPIWKKVTDVYVEHLGAYCNEYEVPYGQTIEKWIETLYVSVPVQYVDGSHGSVELEITPDMIEGYDSTVPGDQYATLQYKDAIRAIYYYVLEKVEEPEEFMPGWNEIDGKWYYGDENGNAVKNAWVDGKYYMGENGAMVTNAWVDGGKYYVGSDGVYVSTTGWFNLDGDYYYLVSGLKQTGWLKGESTKYYLDEKTGVMLANEWLDDTYYFTESGAMATGWLLLDDNYYYFGTNGEKVTNAWVGAYYLKDTGVMAKNEVVDGVYVGADGTKYTGWVESDGESYYYVDGELEKGWTVVGSTWYYLNPETGVKVAEVTGISSWDSYEDEVPYGQTLEDWIATFACFVDVKYADGSTGSETFTVTPDMITGYDSTVSGEHTAIFRLGGFSRELKYVVGEDPNKPEEILTGWNEVSGKWYYFDETGKVVKNTWVGVYYVDENGVMVTNAWVDNGKYYVGADGVYVSTTGWFNLDGDYYYLESGLKQTGWKKVGPAYYYFDDNTGVMLADEWLNDTYYITASGAMATGWLLLGEDYYYFDANGAKVTNQWVGDYYLKDTGVMAKDEVVEGIKVGADGKKVTGWHFADTKWYYYQDGKLATGWTLIGPTYYYFDETTGEMLVDTWVDDTYYITAGGAMATGWLLLDGSYYYMSAGGAKVTNSWVGSYFMDENGVMATNAWVDNGRYYVDASGAYVSASGWFLLDEGYYYLAGGCKQTGWVSLGSTWYYMNPETGVMLANEWLNDTYYMTASGAMATGWLWLDGAYYYMSAGGAKVTNQWMGNYYLQEDGTMATNTWIGNYYVGENGAWDPTKTK